MHVGAGRLKKVPAVSLRSSALSDRLNKDPQLLQAHISSCTHTNDTDTEAVTV